MAESKASVVDHPKGKIEISVTRKYRSFQELGRHQLRFQIGESAGGDPAWISFKKFKDAKDGCLIPTFEICIESSQGACRLKDKDEMPRPWSCNAQLYAETALSHCKDGARHGIVVYHMIVTAVSELLAEQLLERAPRYSIYLSGHNEPLTDFDVLRHIHHVLTTRDAETTKSTKTKKRAKSEADDDESVAKKGKVEDHVEIESVKSEGDLGSVPEHAAVVNGAAKHGEGETLKPAKEEP